MLIHMERYFVRRVEKYLDEKEKRSSYFWICGMKAVPDAHKPIIKRLLIKFGIFSLLLKLELSLIVITLIASALGTIFPQEMYIPPTIPASEYYQDQYGWFGKLYYELGFHNLYSSWWYLLLIASIGVSLVICSLDRVIPLYRALKKQKSTRHEGFLKRQRLFGVTQKVNSDEDTLRESKR